MPLASTFNRSRAKPGVYYLGRTDHEDGQRSITLSISGIRYEYYLTLPECNTVEFLCKRVSARKALNFAKSRASRIVKVQT